MQNSLESYNSKIGSLYIDAHGTLRIVMEELDNGLIRGNDVSNMCIDGIIINENLESIFSGYGDFDSKRHRIHWVE